MYAVAEIKVYWNAPEMTGVVFLGLVGTVDKQAMIMTSEKCTSIKISSVARVVNLRYPNINQLFSSP